MRLPLHRDANGTVRVAAADDPVWPALGRIAVEGGSLAGFHGLIEGCTDGLPARTLEGRAWRAVEADQSNTSLLLDDRVVLKLYRRLRRDPQPERELLEGLTRVGSRRAPTLAGALVYRRDGLVTTLAITYDYVPGEPVGWEPLIGTLTAALDGPPAALADLAEQAGELGRCLGELHVDLRRAFGCREATASDATDARARATTSVAEAITVVAPQAPELSALATPSQRGLQGFDRLAGTSLQRIHGDLHVGQLLRGPAGVVVLDFEGDPTMPPEERRRFASPLQDAASLLLSLDHVAVAAARRRGFGAETVRARSWGGAARAAALSAYAAVDAAGADPALLHALQVEKEWREAVYAARVLPEWFYAPRLVLPELLA